MAGIPILLQPFLICFLRIIDVSLGTVRLIVMLKGKKLLASIIGFVEVFIFISVLGAVLTNIDNIWNMLGYSVGFASGVFLGSVIEEKMALGFMTVQIIPTKEAEVLSEIIRENGFGVTSMEGWGRDGTKVILTTHLYRKDWKKLLKIVESHDQKAVITVMDTKAALGGSMNVLRKK